MTPRGLPGPLPPGEVVLWQGAPEWRTLARTALHVRSLLAYFAVLAALGAVWDGAGRAALIAGLGLVPIAIAIGYAWAVSRWTVYTITNRRIVLQAGLALPVALNVPFARIVSADVKPLGVGGAGDLSLTLSGRDRFSYLVLWPHARPWRFAQPCPTLRGLADVDRPAKVLAHALRVSAVPAMADSPSPAARPRVSVAA